MTYLGTCLQTYIPIRKSPESASEMVSSLIFGESYSVAENKNGFLHIKTDFDDYEGWISVDVFAEFIEFTELVEHVFVEAVGEHQIMFIPCGAAVPENGIFSVDGMQFRMDKKLKTYNHLPLSLRLQKLALSFVNVPYLWGGRSFMGVDCSGFVQVVFKANGIDLARDTSQQVLMGKPIELGKAKPCDLVFFRKPDSTNVSHVGMVLDNNKIIHSSGKVRCDKLDPKGIYMDGELKYLTHSVKRFI